MDIKQYRKQVEEEVRRASQQEPMRLSEQMASAGPARPVPKDAAGKSEAVSVAQDKAADAGLRVLALQHLPMDRKHGGPSIKILLSILRDPSENAQVRLTAIQGMRRAAFVPPLFEPYRPEYLEILRGAARDPDPQLREEALEVLAINKDSEAQRLLLEGLTDPAKALVPPGKAIQFLGYDVHAGHFPVLRKLAVESQDAEVRHEALRFLAADPESKEVLRSLMQDKSRDSRTRTLSAMGLQSLDPAAFSQQARQIVLDDSEDEDLRASCLGALAHFPEYRNVRSDAQFKEKVAGLQSAPASEHLRSAAARFTQSLK